MSRKSDSRIDDVFDSLVSDDGGGDGNPRCDWQWSVCSDSPTHSLVTGADIGMRNAELYCARHFILTVHHLHDVHAKMCTTPFERHIFSYSEL